MKNDICRQETVHLNNHLSSSRVWFLYILFSLISFSKWENVSPLTEIHYQVAVTVYSSGMWWLLKKGQQKQLECVMVWGWVFRKSCCPDSWECFFFFLKYSSLSLSEGIISLTGTVVDQVPITILRDTYDTMWCSAFSDQISYGSDLLVWEIK